MAENIIEIGYNLNDFFAHVHKNTEVNLISFAFFSGEPPKNTSLRCVAGLIEKEFSDFNYALCGFRNREPWLDFILRKKPVLVFAKDTFQEILNDKEIAWILETKLDFINIKISHEAKQFQLSFYQFSREQDIFHLKFLSAQNFIPQCIKVEIAQI